MGTKGLYIDISLSVKDISIDPLQGYTCIAQWSKNILQSLANQLYNLVISAPVYAAQFVQKYGHVEVNQVPNQETRFSGSFQDIVDNMGSKLSSGNEKYDNERFEEI